MQRARHLLPALLILTGCAVPRENAGERGDPVASARQAQDLGQDPRLDSECPNAGNHTMNGDGREHGRCAEGQGFTLDDATSGLRRPREVLQLLLRRLPGDVLPARRRARLDRLLRMLPLRRRPSPGRPLAELRPSAGPRPCARRRLSAGPRPSARRRPPGELRPPSAALRAPGELRPPARQRAAAELRPPSAELRHLPWPRYAGQLRGAPRLRRLRRAAEHLGLRRLRIARERQSAPRSHGRVSLTRRGRGPTVAG